MKRNLIIILAVLVAMTLFTGKSVAPVPVPVAAETEEPAIQMPQLAAIKVEPKRGKEEYIQMLYAIAKERGLSNERVEEIIVTIGGKGPGYLCPNGESSWNKNAVGDGGNSFGLVQIHLPSHPHVTKEQAMDPRFALTFIVNQFSTGNEWMWTCWRAVYDR